MKTRILLLALLAFSVTAFATDNKKVTSEVHNTTEVKPIENKAINPVELKATDAKAEGKSCDTKSGKCCSEKKAKKAKK